MARFELGDGVASIDREAWNRLVGDESPFLEWEFLASLEDAGCVGPRTGWTPRPLLLREGDELIAACPLYAKDHSEGEFVFDWSWADAAMRAGISYYPKLLAGVPFTPVTGARVLVQAGRDRRAILLAFASALRALCVENGLSGVHANFLRDDEREAFVAEGFAPRLGLQYHWRNDGYADFDDFLQRFRSKRRNQVRRELREIATAGIRIEALQGDALRDELAPVLFPLYLTTIEKSPWGRRYLNRRFFELLVERFRRRLCVMLAWRDGRPIAGTINVQKGDALYGRYWGAFGEVRHLHFALCYYAGVRHCIEHGLARFEPGAGGDYKQLRGFDATPTWSVHWLAEPRLATAVARFLDEERTRAAELIEALRDASALKPASEDSVEP